MSKTFILLSSWLRAEFLHQNLNWVCIDKIEDFLKMEKQAREQVRKDNSAIKKPTLHSPPLNCVNNIETVACGLDNSNDRVNDQRPVLNTPHSDVMT